MPRSWLMLIMLAAYFNCKFNYGICLTSRSFSRSVSLDFLFGKDKLGVIEDKCTNHKD